MPRIAVTDRHSWHSAGDLVNYVGIGKRKAEELAERTLNARKVHGSWFLLFMANDNPGILSPRKLMKDLHLEAGIGTEWHEVFDPWRTLSRVRFP